MLTLWVPAYRLPRSATDGRTAHMEDPDTSFGVEGNHRLSRRFARKPAGHVSLLASFAALVVAGTLNGASRARTPLHRGTAAEVQAPRAKPLACTGPITKVIDVADESLKLTSDLVAVPQEGERGQFDKTPVLEHEGDADAGGLPGCAYSTDVCHPIHGKVATQST